jgi:hypothetical protein
MYRKPGKRAFSEYTNDYPVTTAPETPVDLTNQNSPHAATFRNGASYTPLVTPQPLIRLEKVAGGWDFSHF